MQFIPAMLLPLSVVRAGCQQRGPSPGDQALTEIAKLGGSLLVYTHGGQQLREVDLHGTQATHATVGRIKDLARSPVVKVDLSDTPVTDAGFEPLKSLPDLRALVLSGTGVTEAGVREFQQARPEVKIIR
jgi:hypothetical protein